MINVFIVGSKGIPARYGGFETFVENLTKRKTDQNIKYFVSCMGDDKVFEYNNATCFSIPIKKQKASHRIINVSKAITWVENYLKRHNSDDSTNILYILGCRVGLMLFKHKNQLRKLNCHIICNPDGLEWKRDKWNAIEKKILLKSEKKLVNASNYMICDSMGIVDYAKSKYPKFKEQNIKYIAYGCDVSLSSCSNEQLNDWLKQYGSKPNDYYLIIGRFVPENNFSLVIKEYMRSKTKKKLIIITNVEKNDFYHSLENELHFSDDDRIVFAGTCYDEQLVKKIRENAFAYIHGHSVGGTNPSLLEAMGSTRVNLLFDVCFNREVGVDQCLYFSDHENDLSSLVDNLDHNYSEMSIKLNPKKVIVERYSWDYIVSEYERFFNRVAKE